MKRQRSAVILIQDEKVALIKRVNGRGVYFLFPGGGVEADETIEQAAIREAFEELGVTVRLSELISVVHFGESEQYYFSATILDGTFGTGLGEELASPVNSEAGSYTPVWMRCSELEKHIVRPEHLASLISSGSLEITTTPIIVEESVP